MAQLGNIVWNQICTIGYLIFLCIFSLLKAEFSGVFWILAAMGLCMAFCYDVMIKKSVRHPIPALILRLLPVLGLFLFQLEIFQDTQWLGLLLPLLLAALPVFFTARPWKISAGKIIVFLLGIISIAGVMGFLSAQSGEYIFDSGFAFFLFLFQYGLFFYSLAGHWDAFKIIRFYSPSF